MDEQVHLILGPETFLAERAREAIIGQIRGGREGITVTDMRAGDVTAAELLGVLSPSLFGDDRIVVLHDADRAGDEAAEQILKAAVDPGPGIYLVVEHTGKGRTKKMAQKLAKIAHVWPADEIKQRDLHSWVNREFREHDAQVAPDVVRAVLEGVGSDPRELAIAVEQLVEDADGPVTTAVVRAYYAGVAEVSNFDIADWAVSGQTSRAVAAVRRALQLGENPVTIASALSNKVGMIARLYSTRGRADETALARELGAHPFVIKKTLPVARRWSGKAVSRAVILMAELDAEVKGQGGQAEYAVENAVRRVARLAG